METLLQVVTVALGVFAIIWHQQRTIDKLRDSTSQAIGDLRDDTNQAMGDLRDGTNQAFDKLRDDTSRAIGKLGTEVAANGQRLARIEGFLGIGIPEADGPTQRPTEGDEPEG